MSEKYVTKAEILEWVNVQQPDLTAADIPDFAMGQGHVKVDAEIIRRGEFDAPTENDTNSFLKYAAGSFILALLCKVGIITQTSGELLTNKFGEVTYQYHRTNPMFFFAQGTSKPFEDLLPYETLRMYAYSFVRAYLLWSFRERTGQRQPKPKMARDGTSRGAYWRESRSDRNIADYTIGKGL